MKIPSAFTRVAAVLISLALAPGLFAQTGEPNQLALITPTAPSKHMELFNGKDFSGWTFFMRDSADPAQTWSVADGLIRCTGKPTGYLRTEKDYRDYKLTIE